MVNNPHAAHPFFTYSSAVLAFRLGTSCRDRLTEEIRPTDVEGAVSRAVRMVQQTNRPRLLILGLGDGRLAHALAAPGVLPEDIELTVCETDPEHVRTVSDTMEKSAAHPPFPDWVQPAGKRQLLVDASPHALFLLLALHGYNPKQAVIMQNPSAPRTQKLQDLQRLLASASQQDIPEQSNNGVQDPPTIASILHPEEPALDALFAQAPAWVREWIVVWDSNDVPGEARRIARENSPVPVTHLARPLSGDFAAQRNACLNAVQSDYVFFLDGDERLRPESWALLPRLTAMGLDGWRLPRRTLYPDAQHCKVGYGLWPDFQLRLIRTGPGVRFERPVHERVTGLTGKTGIVPSAPIIHLSRLLKNPEQLAHKLHTFDKAGQGLVSHRLAHEYPSCDCAVLDAAGASWHSTSLVLSADHA